MRTNRSSLLVVAAGFIAAGAVVFYWVLAAGALSPLQGRGYEVRALVPRAGTVTPGSRVRIAGVVVGRVSEVQQADTGTRLSLQIDEKHTPLPSDTRTAIRIHTLVGENYVELRPGRSPQPLSDGGLLPMSQAIEDVDIDEVLSVFKGKNQEGARALLTSAGRGLRGRGDDLNDTVEQASGFITSAAPVTKVLDQRRRDVASLIDDLGRLMGTIGEREAGIRRLARGAKVTTAAIASRDEALRATLAELPSTLQRARSTTKTLQAITGKAAPVLAGLGEVLYDASPAVSALWPAATDARTLINELGAAAPKLRTTLNRVTSVSGPATQALPELGKVMCELNPAVAFLKPYAADVGTALQHLGSVTNYYDATGHAARLLPLVNPYTSGIQGYDQQTAATLQKLLTAGPLGRAVQTGYAPLPRAGKINDPTVGAGVVGPDSVTEKFPRVQAAC